jgi:lysine 2,3-aminomutase
MLVRYQAEDKPTTARPVATRGVSALLQGSKSALIPENSERMARRRELTVITNHTAAEEPDACASNGCCNGNAHAHAPTGKPTILSLNVLANGCGS